MDIPAEHHNGNHQHEVEQVDGEEVFPLQLQKLVDTQTGEGPLEPYYHERDKERFAKEPHNRGYVAHNLVETVPSLNAERHPAAEEHQRGHAGDDEQVEVFGKIEETEMDTGIFRMVSGGKLRLGLGEVERATVGLGRTGDKVDYESYYCRDMRREYKPAVFLRKHYLVDIHRSGKSHHGEDGKPYGKLVADHLGTRAQSAHEGELIVRRPSGKEYAEYAYRRAGYEEEDADVEIDNLEAVAPGQDGETEHRGDNHQVWSQREKELIDMLKLDNLLYEHLEHIGERLEKSPRTNPVRPETALEPCAYLTLVKDVEQSEHGIHQQQPDTDQHTLQKGGAP